MAAKSTLAGLFGRSPFGPMQEHMRVVEACAAELVPCFAALAAGDREGLLRSKERIFELEEKADVTKNEIRSHLPRSLFMPVDRRDLLEVLHRQDSIADTAQDVAGLLELREPAIPEGWGEVLSDYVRHGVEAVTQCRKVIDELDELLEMGFRGRPVERVEEMVAAINELESRSDDDGMELTRRLFGIDRELSPADFLVWYELIRHLGDIADYAEDVGDRVRLLIAR